LVVPPSELGSLPRHAMEMVFVLDCSGSMSGEPIKQAKDAIAHALGELGPQDSFQIIRFSNDASALGKAPLPATPKNIKLGLSYLRGLNGDGGTMMIEGIKAALDFPHDENKLRVVCFMTDGYIGNEADILRAVKERVGSARIFSFGVGSSPNRYLMERMAGLGRGTAAYVGPHDDGAEVMDAFFSRASRPAMTGLEIDWQGAHVSEVYPNEARDLFVGRPIIITGRFKGELPGRVAIKGRVGGEPVRMDVQVDPVGPEGNHEALAGVWARTCIADLADRQAYTGDPHRELADRIKRLALDYNLVSAYTAFLAVDAGERTAGTEGVTVNVPVPVPDGVRYETTVSE
jgi:Ca-activated chloride channel family protein